MPEKFDEAKLVDTVLLAALSICFKTGEEFLAEAQLIIRGYAPSEIYCKHCINRLIANGVVEYKSVRGSVNNEQSRFLRNPDKELSHIKMFAYSLIRPVFDEFEKSEVARLTLKELHREILACECIEYAEYHAHKCGVTIVNSSPFDAKLSLLVREEIPEVINALIWRKLKSQSSKKSTEEIIEFTELMESVFELYVKNKQCFAPMKQYPRPKHMPLSILGNILAVLFAKL